MSSISSDRIRLTLDIITVGRKRVDVRADLTVKALLDNVRDRWNLAGAPMQMTLGADNRPLPSDRPLNTLNSLGVLEGAVLICRPQPQQTSTAALIATGRRIKLSRAYRKVSLVEPNSLREFEIQWQPAVIGRRDPKDEKMNQMLAVDVTTLDPKFSVSRQHACITETNGAFEIEVLQNRNPLYVNDRRLVPGERTAIATNASIRLGVLQLTFRITE